MQIRIHDSQTGSSYLAQRAEDCRSDAERSAYEAAAELGETISMGSIVAEVVYEAARPGLAALARRRYAEAASLAEDAEAAEPSPRAGERS